MHEMLPWLPPRSSPPARQWSSLCPFCGVQAWACQRLATFLIGGMLRQGVSGYQRPLCTAHTFQWYHISNPSRKLNVYLAMQAWTTIGIGWVDWWAGLNTAFSGAWSPELQQSVFFGKGFWCSTALTHNSLNTNQLNAWCKEKIIKNARSLNCYTTKNSLTFLWLLMILCKFLTRLDMCSIDKPQRHVSD